MASRPSIAELRAVLAGSPSDELIESLRQDPRTGVRQLLASFDRRRDAAARKHAHAEGLYRPMRDRWSAGYRLVGGIDEAGRGPLAGPVVAACVILPPEPVLHVDDSKKLTPAQRDDLYDQIRATALSLGIGIVPPDEIDELNIYRASRKAMMDAYDACRPQRPDYCFVDAMPLPDLDVPHRSIIHGDAVCAAIAAASIIAKVTRDRIMVAEDATYPEYGFARHKGYGAPEHLAALERVGPCPIHRVTFAPVTAYVLPSARFFTILIDRSTSVEALQSVGDRIKAAAADLTAAELDELRERWRTRRGELGGSR